MTRLAGGTGAAKCLRRIARSERGHFLCCTVESLSFLLSCSIFRRPCPEGISLISHVSVGLACIIVSRKRLWQASGFFAAPLTMSLREIMILGNTLFNDDQVKLAMSVFAA